MVRGRGRTARRAGGLRPRDGRRAPRRGASSAPAGGVGEWYRGAGGLRLRAGFWQPAGEARGTVILSPGRTEPIEKYYEVIGDFLRRGFCVLAHDWRGQGLSERALPNSRKGHVHDFSGYDRDLESFVKEIVLPREDSRPRRLAVTRDGVSR